MSAAALERAARTASLRVVGALAARFRDLDLAEDAFAQACLRAAESWTAPGPADPTAWLYRVALRCALDALRRRRTRERYAPDAPPPEPTVEDRLAGDHALIPDERLRLIFICCHPAVAPDARAALTLRLVCGLSTAEIARAFLVSEPTLAQRLVRAKRKIAEARVPFEVPGPEAWPGRLDAVLSTIEVAYAKAHEDAAAAGPHAGYAREALDLTRELAELLPAEPDVLALAALVRYAEARRPARLDPAGAMIPLAEQDPVLWDRAMLAQADLFLARVSGWPTPRAVQAAIHGAWCARRSLRDPAPWPKVLALYDLLLASRDDAVVRLNRIVALAEVAGVEPALAELSALAAAIPQDFQPYHAVRADLLRRAGRADEAARAYDTALALTPGPAERRFLERRHAGLSRSTAS